MTNPKIDGRVAFTKPVRAIFCNVLTARKFKDKGKEKGEAKFDATFILDQADYTAVVQKAVAVAKIKWPGRDIKELRFPFKKAAQSQEKAKAKGKDPSIYPDGTYVMTARSQYAPALSRFVSSTPKSFGAQDADEAKAKFYNGCWVVPCINFVPYEGDDKDGISAYLDAALWIKDGEKIGGGGDPAQTFSAYVGTVSAESPTGGGDLDDEIPF